MLHNISSPTTAYIDLKAFQNNINYIRSLYPHSKIILPVKANAYGHGDVVISKEAEKLGIEYLAIARLSEGYKLRDNKINLPIISLGVELGENIGIALDGNIELSVSSINYLKLIEEKARKKNKVVPIHVKINTGMNRLGCSVEEGLDIIRMILASDYLTFKSLYTHLARSDDDQDFTNSQISQFLELIELLKSKHMTPSFYHMYNSGAILKSLPISSDFAIRPGIMAYGYTPFKNEENEHIIPVMTLKSHVINIKFVPKGEGISYNHTYTTDRDTHIAIIPIGYGDGIPRALSNKMSVTINNQNYPQRGSITMDLMMIEVDANVNVGDDVIIFGDKRYCSNDAKSLAEKANTICYEIITNLPDRIERIPI